MRVGFALVDIKSLNGLVNPSNELHIIWKTLFVLKVA